MRSAARDPVLADEAPRLFAGIGELLVGKGRRFTRVDLASADRPADDELTALVVGRTGKLRAPSMRVGDKLVVGYNAEMLREVFGAIEVSGGKS